MIFSGRARGLLQRVTGSRSRGRNEREGGLWLRDEINAR